MNRLTTLANKYKTDKGTEFEEKHSYSLIYDKYIPETGSYNLLEIGIDKGASLRMWKEYNPQMKLFAADHNPACLKNIDLTMLEKFYQIEQTVRETMIKIPSDNTFDYIVEDGAHFMHTHQITLAVLLSCVKNGGLYIIEDLHTCDMQHFNKNPSDSTKVVLKNWQNTGKFVSSFLTDAENEYISKNISSVTFECCDKVVVITKV
jgi:hypothetical protein